MKRALVGAGVPGSRMRFRVARLPFILVGASIPCHTATAA
jgi:hypothetical protein